MSGDEWTAFPRFEAAFFCLGGWESQWWGPEPFGFLFPNSRPEFYTARADQFLHKLISKVLIKDAPKMFWVLWEMLSPDLAFCKPNWKVHETQHLSTPWLSQRSCGEIAAVPFNFSFNSLWKHIASFALSNCIVHSQLYLSGVEEAAGETLGHSLRRVILNPGMGKRPKRSAAALLPAGTAERAVKPVWELVKLVWEREKGASGRQYWSGDLPGWQGCWMTNVPKAEGQNTALDLPCRCSWRGRAAECSSWPPLSEVLEYHWVFASLCLPLMLGKITKAVSKTQNVSEEFNSGLEIQS